MLEITVPEREFFDEGKQEFTYIKAQYLQLEHSLVSLSKWESKWCKPFLDKKEKTTEMIIDYIRCMTITQNIKPGFYTNLPIRVFTEIKEYIDAPMTATWFNNEPPGSAARSSREVITSEIIYDMMISLNIPVEFQKWHLNRLLTLIRVCNIKNTPNKRKMNKKEMLANRRALNEARRAQINSKG